MSPSQARNALKKCLKALIDPKPKKEEKERIWSFFQSKCAYCGKALTKESRKGHIDHLYSEMEGGSNKLSNLVLTCASCNGDEKREESWEGFLATKCAADRDTYLEKSRHIADWVKINGAQPMLTKEQIEILPSEFESVNEALTKSVERLRNGKM